MASATPGSLIKWSGGASLSPHRDGRHFLDEHAATEFLHRQRLRALLVLGLLLLAVVAFCLLGP